MAEKREKESEREREREGERMKRGGKVKGKKDFGARMKALRARKKK